MARPTDGPLPPPDPRRGRVPEFASAVFGKLCGGVRPGNDTPLPRWLSQVCTPPLGRASGAGCGLMLAVNLVLAVS
jgi:hypothetical protein